MTDTLEATDLELIELLDFEPELACEVTGRNTTHTSVVAVARCRNCALSFLICEQHLSDGRAKFSMTCSGCEYTTDALDLTFEVIPIGPS